MIEVLNGPHGVAAMVCISTVAVFMLATLLMLLTIYLEYRR